MLEISDNELIEAYVGARVEDIIYMAKDTLKELLYSVIIFGNKNEDVNLAFSENVELVERLKDPLERYDLKVVDLKLNPELNNFKEKKFSFRGIKFHTMALPKDLLPSCGLLPSSVNQNWLPNEEKYKGYLNESIYNILKKTKEYGLVLYQK